MAKDFWTVLSVFLILHLYILKEVFYSLTSVLRAVCLSIINTTFKHKCTCHQGTLGCRSMIDFVNLSSDLQPHVLDLQVKREAELSTDHHLVMSLIRWQERLLDCPSTEEG